MVESNCPDQKMINSSLFVILGVMILFVFAVFTIDVQTVDASIGCGTNYLYSANCNENCYYDHGSGTYLCQKRDYERWVNPYDYYRKKGLGGWRTGSGNNCPAWCAMG
jgi:hypothetical protein